MKYVFLIKTRNNNYYIFNKKKKIYFPINKEEYDLITKITENNKPILNKIENNRINSLINYGFFNKNKDEIKFYNITSKDIINNLSNINQLTFEVTNNCNLNCVYCLYGDTYNSYGSNKIKYLEFKDAKYIIDYLISFINSNKNTSNGSKLFVSFYGGEPSDCLKTPHISSNC